MAEPVDLSFGSWTWVGWRMHNSNRIHHVAPTCSIALCRELCKNGYSDWFAGGPKLLSTSSILFARWRHCAQVQLYSSSGTNVPSWEGTLAPRGECDWTVRLRQRCGLMSNHFYHLSLSATGAMSGIELILFDRGLQEKSYIFPHNMNLLLRNLAHIGLNRFKNTLYRHYIT